MARKPLGRFAILVVISGGVIAAVIATFGGVRPAATPIPTSECEKLIADAAPVLAAVRQYEKRTGHVPQSLGELVPHDLPALPAPRVASGHDYLYGVESNQWRLAIPLPGRKDDVLMYSSIGDYLKDKPGFATERIGTWARYHDVP